MYEVVSEGWALLERHPLSGPIGLYRYATELKALP